MNKEVKYNGYSAQPSDYECQDGDLTLSLNLIKEDNALHPILFPQTILTIPSPNLKVIYNHTINDSLSLFLCFDSNSRDLVCINSKTLKITCIQSSLSSSPISVTSIGKTLVISFDSGLQYYIWENDKNEYKFLGNSIPKIDTQIALNAWFLSKSFNIGKNLEFIKASDAGYSGDLNGDFLEEIKSEFLPANSIIYSEGYSIPDISVEKGSQYEFQLDYTGPFMYYNLIIRDADGKTHEATGGAYGGKGSFVAKASGSLQIHFTYTIEGAINGPDWKIPYDISYKLFKGTYAGNIDPDTLVPANNKENINLFAGAINKFVKEDVADKNLFAFPFFARFAVKLYDGSYTHISPPILLIPNSSLSPLCLIRRNPDKVNDYVDVCSFVAMLCVKFSPFENISDWENLISGVDIFVSKPCYLYNQAVELSENIYPFLNFSKHSSLLNSFSEAIIESKEKHLVRKYNIKSFLDSSGLLSQPYALSYLTSFAPYSAKDIINNLKGLSNFYRVASIDLQTIVNSNGFFSPELLNGSLSNLVTQTPLNDDIINTERFKASSLFSYNNRLHIINSSLSPANPVPPFLFTQLSDSFCSDIWMRVFINSDDGIKIVDKKYYNQSSSFNLHWVYDENPKAFKIQIVVNLNSQFCCWDIDLESHQFLNGAFAISESLNFPFPYTLTNDNIFAENFGKSQIPVPKKNIIYLSEVNNPFVFSNSSAVSLGVSEVLALSSAAKALSQGQFGQFPLYAFTSEGIWALETSASGSYSARQPITRDVCNNTNAITQIDSAVLFTTDRGIMLISGSSTHCISDEINVNEPFNILKLPGIEKLHDMLGHDADTCLPTAPFLDFISECGILYDYVHQRVIVYNPYFTYAYLYSLKSKEWGMMFSQIEAGINSYPDALATDHNGNILNFSNNDVNINVMPVTLPALFITRPLKLDIPNIHKTIDTIIQRGFFAKEHIGTVLYGSQDLINWHLIWSSKGPFLRGFRGTPYKYYRIAALANLSPNESISGASIQFTPRFTNQPR